MDISYAQCHILVQCAAFSAGGNKFGWVSGKEQAPRERMEGFKETNDQRPSPEEEFGAE